MKINTTLKLLALLFGSLTVLFSCKVANHNFSELLDDSEGGVPTGDGGQAVVKQNADGTNTWLFVDILKPDELENIKPQLLPAKAVTTALLNPKGKCAYEMFLQLRPGIWDLPDNLPSWAKTTEAEAHFYPARKIAETRLTAAADVLDFKLTNPDGSEYTPHFSILSLINNITLFRSTFFRLPQERDATSIGKKFQVQIAYHQHGITYLQTQIMAQLSTELRAAVFIKENLRYINWRSQLKLDNKAIELATFNIYHGYLTQFKKSEFGKKLVASIKAFDNQNYEKYLEKYHVKWLKLMSTRDQDIPFYSDIEGYKTPKPLYYSIATRYNVAAPAGKAWDLETKKLVSIGKCKKTTK